MRLVARLALVLALFLALAIAGLALLGPREAVDFTRHFNSAPGPATQLDTLLADSEARFDDIVPGVEKRVIWAGAPGEKTALAIVYLHGFSASSEEIRPVPDRLATALGANLYYTRLAGHGRSGGALDGPGVADWVRDLDEALAIGHVIGERVIVLATSTGATLAAIAAQDAERSQGIAGYALISPNFRIRNPAARLLTWPGARIWLPWLIGEERAFTPQNPEHARYWTNSYPVRALLPMAALVKAVRGLDFSEVKTPTLMLYAPGDMVVDARETAAIAARWGGPLKVVEVTPGPGTDPNAHVIAGDILSPGRTDETIALLLDWAKGLEE